MVPDLCVGQDDTALQTDSLADLGAGANDDVGADDCCRVDFGCGVDEDVAAVYPLVLRGVREEWGVLGGQVGEVEAGSCLLVGGWGGLSYQR